MKFKHNARAINTKDVALNSMWILSFLLFTMYFVTR